MLSGWSRSLPAVEHVRDICFCIHQAFLIKENAALTVRLTKLSTVHEGAVYNSTDFSYLWAAREAKHTFLLQIQKRHIFITFSSDADLLIQVIYQTISGNANIAANIKHSSTIQSLVCFISPGTHPEECQVLHLLRGLSSCGLWWLVAASWFLVSRSVAC